MSMPAKMSYWRRDVVTPQSLRQDALSVAAPNKRGTGEAMGYDELVKSIGDNGQGIHPCKQSDFMVKSLRVYDESIQAKKHDWRGHCLGLVVTWLRCKKADEKLLSSGMSFWAPWAESESTSLLGASKKSSEALKHQRTLKLKSESDTVSELEKDGLTLSVDHKIEKSCAVSMGWLALLDTILTESPRFFILGLTREKGGHAVGFMRQWVMIGKSTTTYFFDPNFGEVQANNRSGLEVILKAIDNGTLYKNRYRAKHILYPFSY
jgi:hypothetical protein